MMQYVSGVHFEKLGGKGKAAHFYGANGFPTGCYQPLFSQLTKELSLTSLNNRATWPQQHLPRKLNWQTYADDLIGFLEGHADGPVIGIGHSLGATATLFAAIKRPELFSQLVLIEPAMTTPLFATLLPFVPFPVTSKVQPIKYTVAKPELWPSVDSFYHDLRQRRVFKRIKDKNLRILAEHSLVPAHEQHLRLKFPKMWEAKNYASAPNLFKYFAQNTLATTAIRGKPSIYFTEQSWQVWQQKSPNAHFEESLDYGHLFPLEAPELCAEIILSSLNQAL